MLHGRRHLPDFSSKKYVFPGPGCLFVGSYLVYNWFFRYSPITSFHLVGRPDGVAHKRPDFFLAQAPSGIHEVAGFVLCHFHISYGLRGLDGTRGCRFSEVRPYFGILRCVTILLFRPVCGTSAVYQESLPEQAFRTAVILHRSILAGIFNRDFKIR